MSNTNLQDDVTVTPKRNQEKQPPFGKSSALLLNVEELGERLGGLGRGRIAWDCYSNGIDPQLFFSGRETSESVPQVQKLLPNSRQTQTLGKESLELLLQVNGGLSVEDGIASLVHVSRSQDNTTKLLLKLHDGLQVETVLIPSNGKRRQRTTVCISSQVGCRQACTFCATGRMGKLRNLNPDEILVQLFYAIKLCRQTFLPPVSNVVFMGMGEPADNIEAVIQACHVMTTRELFQLSRTRILISTVAPTPNAFHHLAQAPAILAWSVHAARDDLRRQLVPTTKYSMVELRQGLIDALLLRKDRTCMLEVALMDQVNDSIREADEMVEFVKEIIKQVPHVQIVVNLIPYNTHHQDQQQQQQKPDRFSNYRKPSLSRVLAFSNRLAEQGLYVRIRETRGDDESAACGQLATQKQNKMDKHNDV